MSSKEVMPQHDPITGLLDAVNDDSAIKDFESARTNVTALLQTVTDSVKLLANIADQSQSSKDYEALAKLVDTGVATAKALLDLQSKIRTIHSPSASTSGKSPEAAVKNINNVFVGSTAELSKFMADMKKGKIIDLNKEEE